MNELGDKAIFQAMTEMVALNELVTDDRGNPVDYRIIDCNPAFTKIMGIERDAAVGRLATEVYETTPPLFLNVFAEVAMTGAAQRCNSYYAPMDRYFVFSVVSPERGKFLIITTDITTKRKAQKELQKSEERYCHLLEDLNTSFCFTDANRVITFVSSSIKRNFGYTSESLIGEKLDRFFVDPGEIQTMGSLIDKNGIVTNFEAAMRHRDGSILWVAIDAKVILDERGVKSGVEGVIRNITQRRHAENDLQTLIESLVVTPGPDFFKKIVENICQWLGCETAIIGTVVDQKNISCPAVKSNMGMSEDISFPFAESPCAKVIERGFTFYPKDVCELFPGNEYLTGGKAQGYVGTPLLGGDGKPIGVLCAISSRELNLTKRMEKMIFIIAARVASVIEQQQLEKEQKELQEELQQAQKMEAIGTLAGGIAHDFNNILFPIMGHTEMLMEDFAEDSPPGESLKEIYLASLRARDLVRQILTFARQEDGELLLLKVQPIIKEALKLIRSSIPTSIRIDQKISSDCGAVNADPTQIYQVIMNLTINAFHAMEKSGGTMTVSLERVELGEKDLMEPDMACGPFLRLSVADTGIGMDEETVSKIFNPFYTSKLKGKGTGMGLPVVHGIIRNLGGGCEVVSTPGVGSCFSVYLPAKITSSRKDHFLGDEISLGNNERILIVDDEPSILAIERKILERLGYRVTSIDSGTEALALFNENPQDFDLVITDMGMPAISGDALTVELIKIRPDIPILVCTGFSEHLDEQNLRSLGIRGVIMKPIVTRDMAQMIRKALDN